MVSATSIRIFYYQGMTHDEQGHFYFDGVDNGLFMTNSSFKQIVGTTPYIPADVAARDKYNHIGAIAFSKVAGVLLPMECYDPAATNLELRRHWRHRVADPVTLAWKYEVKLDPATIKKAMWAAVSPDGKLLWTSADNNLLAYSMADISSDHSWPAHPRIAPVRTLKKAVPPSGVDGGAFYRGRLYLAGTVGNTHQVWSVNTSNGARRLEISRAVVGEQEALTLSCKATGTFTRSRCAQTRLVAQRPTTPAIPLRWCPPPDGDATARRKTPPTYAAATILLVQPELRVPRSAFRRRHPKADVRGRRVGAGCPELLFLIDPIAIFSHDAPWPLAVSPTLSGCADRRVDMPAGSLEAFREGRAGVTAASGPAAFLAGHCRCITEWTFSNLGHPWSGHVPNSAHGTPNGFRGELLDSQPQGSTLNTVEAATTPRRTHSDGLNQVLTAVDRPSATQDAEGGPHHVGDEAT